MAVDHESLEGVPLRNAAFDEKIQEVRNSAFGRMIAKLPIPSLGVLRPSFLDRSAKAKPQHPTAWLDGLRGIAAFFVFVYHYQHLFHGSYLLGYGSNEGKNDHWLIQLPIIRLIFTGGPMVSVFWVLSGVSLSLKPIQLARSQSWDKFFDTLFSSVFRRGLRLYLPVLAVQVGVLLATLIGLYDHAFALAKDWPFAGTNEKQHEAKETMMAQIQDWALSMWKLVNPFKPYRPSYDAHLWTIPLEFRNSIILFATLAGFAKLKPRVRVAFTLALYAYLVVIEEGDTALFIAGMACAEFLMIRDEGAKRLPSAETTHPEKAGQSIKIKAIWTIVYVIGLHLLSWPAHRYEHAWGYVTIYNWTPSWIGSAEMTWQRIGAAVVLLALCGSEYLRKPFSHPLSVYLGKISFPLYIVHGPVNHILGYWLVPFFWSITGNASLFSYEVGIVLAFATEAVVVVWLADLVMRTIDTPSVRFGRTLQTWCTS